MTTPPAVGRVPIAPDVAADLRTQLQALCQRVAAQIVDAVNADGAAVDQTELAMTAMVTAAEAVAAAATQLQRWLWDEAARRGVSVSAVARARGVTQQTQSRLTQRAQQR